MKKTNKIKLNINQAVILAILLIGLSFTCGYLWAKNKTKAPATTGKQSTTATDTITFTKTDKPVLDFYVMSFCPYGQMAEAWLKPVFDLIGSKVDIMPHFILNKFNSNAELVENCKLRTGDQTKCAEYVTKKWFASESECKKTISANYTTCIDTKDYIKSSTGALYASLHGRTEANMNIRQVCAWKQTEDKKQWWTFIENFNKTCNLQNADTCWEDIAKKAGFDTTKITECFNKDGINILEKEIAKSDKAQASYSPFITINGSQFPPETAKGDITIGKKTIAAAQIRTAETMKLALCAAFKKAPKECDTVIAEAAAAAQAPAAGCAN